MTVVINTPNGHIGRRVTQRLLDSDVPVRVIARAPDKVIDLTSRGAEIAVGPSTTRASSNERWRERRRRSG